MDLRRTETELDWRENHRRVSTFELRWWNRINSERQADRVSFAVAIVAWCGIICGLMLLARWMYQ